MKINCPITTCQAENDMLAEVCGNCGIPLHGYIRISTYPSHLFNRGLSEARQGQVALARDLFAAVVYWCPSDHEARNALAMACYALGDTTEARHQWETILARFPTDTLAQRGLAALMVTTSVNTRTVKTHEMKNTKQNTETRSKKKPEHRKKGR